MYNDGQLAFDGRNVVKKYKDKKKESNAMEKSSSYI